ncbi:TfoX/Sxy family protein [Serratia microhaemolytica]|uniref:TfoX/Sxy family protein n=1 Tax=Serratia microhaemolytica TaxID=2675110 RepID=UPI000FDD0587|nr:TfoX/Sxy family protein [Serratia microhaemolytica]
MKGKSEQRVEQAKVQFSALGNIATRPQFGGYALLADGTLFAMVDEGELYLRATKNLEPTFRARGMRNMTHSKRGIPITMRYYRVDENLWLALQELCLLAYRAICEARAELKQKTRHCGNLKDLPNIDATTVRWLWRVDIKNSYELRLLGAKNSFLRLQTLPKKPGLKTLLELAGALSGYHPEVLPPTQREELTEWFKNLQVKQKEKRN